MICYAWILRVNLAKFGANLMVDFVSMKSPKTGWNLPYETGPYFVSLGGMSR